MLNFTIQKNSPKQALVLAIKIIFMNKYFTHPFVQVLSFSFILIHGFVWIPYVYAIIIGLMIEFELFAFAGLLGIIFCLLSNYYYKIIFQILATILMTSSLWLYLNIPETVAKTDGLNNTLTGLTIFLFAYTQVTSIASLLKRKLNNPS